MNDNDNVLKLMVGKSGSGKNYICDLFGFNSIPSYTTRPMRNGEVEGREHIFISKEEYVKKYHNKPLPAWTNFNNNYYFATFEQIENLKYNVFIIDVDGLDWIWNCKKHNLFKRQITLMLVNSSVNKRFYRMLKRDGLKQAINRIINDRKAFNRDKLLKVIQKHNIQNYYILEN